jgi:Leucine-rich repeat (LRR) protein
LRSAGNLRRLSVARTKVTAASSVVIASLPQLQALNISNVIDQLPLRRAIDVHPLTELIWQHARLSKASDLYSLASSIQYLDLGDNPIDDKALQWLDKADQLQKLLLPQTQVSGGLLRRIPHPEALLSLDLEATTLRSDEVCALLSLATSLRSVNLGKTNVGDRVALAVFALPMVTSIQLHSTKLTDAGLGGLEAHVALQRLFLSDTSVTDAIAPKLANLPGLVSLALRGTAISDLTVTQIKKMTTLELLDLGQVQPEPETWIGLHALVELRQLYVDRSTVDGFAELALLHNLESLHLPVMTNDADLALAVSHAPLLRELAVDDSKITDASANTIAGLSKLRELSVAGTKVTDAFVAGIAKLTLQTLVLGQTDISKAVPLQVMTSLQALGLSRTTVDDATISRLVTLPELSQLAISHSAVTADVYPELAALPMLMWVELKGVRPAASASAKAAEKLLRRRGAELLR